LAFFHEFKFSLTDNGLASNKFSYRTALAATLIFPKLLWNMVPDRDTGYWIFGQPKKPYFAKLPSLPKIIKNPLRRLITWKSTVMSIRCEDGGVCRHGNSYMAPETDITMAIIPIGYGHGI